MNMEFFSWLNLGWVGSVIGIAGLIFGVVTFIKSYKTIIPCYQHSTNVIVGKKESEASKDIEISFKGKSVDNVKRTVIAIWNDGKNYLDQSVILKEKPLTIRFNDGEILSHQIKSKTSESIDSKTSLSENGGVVVDFNYLDFKEGFCVELIHTSNHSEPSLTCIIKGVKSGFINKGKIIPTQPLNNSRKLLYIIPVIGFFMVLAGLVAFHLANMKKNGEEDFLTHIDSLSTNFLGATDKNVLNGWVMLIMGIAYISFPLITKFINRTKTPKNMDVA